MKAKIYILLLAFFYAFTVFSQQTYMVRDLNPIGDGFDNEKTGLFCEVNNQPIFLAYAKGGIRLLCTTDGTSVGTASLMPPIATDVEFNGWVRSDNDLFWFILNKDDRAELYSSDGTWDGTQLRYEVVDEDARFRALRAYKDGVVFHEETESFTEYLTRFDIANGRTSLGQLNWFGSLLDMCVVGNEIWGIGAFDQGISDRYIWRTDGVNPATTFYLLNQGSEFNQGIRMTAVGDKAFFFYAQNPNPRQLWVTDGTGPGTMSLGGFANFGTTDLFDNLDHIANDGLFYFQGECQDSCSDYGHEMWRSDGTLDGTFMLGNLDNDTGDSRPHRMQSWRGDVVFTARNSTWNNQIWRTDGTVAGTGRVLSNFAWNDYHGIDMVIYNDSLFFGGKMGSTGSEVFISNGTPTSTFTLSDESISGQFSFSPNNFLVAGGKVYFTAKNADDGRELWCYDASLPPLVGSETILNAHEVTTYPNPSLDVLNVDFEKSYKDLTVSILSQEGRVISELNFDGDHSLISLPVSNLAAGTYWMFIQTENTPLVIKPFVKN